MLTAAICAPSEGNLQPWRFYVISHEAIKTELAIAAYDQMFIAEAPLLLFWCVLIFQLHHHMGRGEENCMLFNLQLQPQKICY